MSSEWMRRRVVEKRLYVYLSSERNGMEWTGVEWSEGKSEIQTK